MIRRNTKKVHLGSMFIGGDSPITVQSMTNTDTRDINATIDQIKRLENVGCDIVRIAILDEEAAKAIKVIKKSIKIPLVADIHFDYRLAIMSIENGVDKIRINPGNIGESDNIKKVVLNAKERGIPIRIGVNSGSVEKSLIEKYNGVTSKGMAESALNNIKILEDLNFDDIIISIKASNVPMTISAYEYISKKTHYPLHLGVTEAGTPYKGIIKSSIGIGSLLYKGIGDTIRVSLTGDVEEEVTAGIEILKALHIRNSGIEFVSCPTCGRCQIDLISIAKKVEQELAKCDKTIKVAIMGCAVNGPGEAKEADIGIAGGKGDALLFKKGVIIKKIAYDKIVEELINEIEKM